MSYLLSILADKPLGLWMMDDTTPFQDYSGYGRNGVIDIGSPTTGLPMVASALFSQIFSSTVVGKFDSPVLAQGYETQEFSLEASFRVIDESGSTTSQKILSSTANYDGITVNGTTVKFSTKYLTAGECAVSWDIQSKRNVHVVGVHSSDKNQLFIDGILVGQTALTDAQKLDSYVTTDGKLWLGTTTSAQKVSVNGLCIYATGLSDDIVKAHFNAARRTTLIDTIAPTFNGVRFPMSVNLSDTFVLQTWSLDSDWKQGTLSQASIVNSQLVPQIVAGVSVAGNWTVVLPLDCGKTSVYGLSLVWDGYGVVVEVSLDAVTWETAVRGKKLTTIPNAFNPTNKDLLIRVSFPGSIADDPSYIDNLSATGFTTGLMPNVSGRTVTFTDPASPMLEAQPIEQRDDWGVRLLGGSVVIGADTTTDPMDVYTLNVWVKKLTSTSPTFSISGTTNYKNGTAGGTMNQGEWTMWTMTKATAITGSITISGDVQIGQIEFFDHQLTAQEVADLYTSSTGVAVTKAPDADAIVLTNPNPSTRIYDYTWGITSAG